MVNIIDATPMTPPCSQHQSIRLISGHSVLLLTGLCQNYSITTLPEIITTVQKHTKMGASANSAGRRYGNGENTNHILSNLCNTWSLGITAHQQKRRGLNPAPPIFNLVFTWVCEVKLFTHPHPPDVPTVGHGRHGPQQKNGEPRTDLD